MAIKLKNGRYQCSMCDKVFVNPMVADAHRDNEHDLIIVQMDKPELWRLLQFIYKYGSFDPELLPSKLIERMQKLLTFQSAVKIKHNTSIDIENE